MKAYPQIHHFSQGNPEGTEQGDVPTLLRRVAASLESLGIVSVQHIAFENEVNENDLRPSLTVYFHYGDLHKDCQCGRCLTGTPPALT